MLRLAGQRDAGEIREPEHDGANKAVSPGIQAVTSRRRVALDGRPRLFLVRGALIERTRRWLRRSCRRAPRKRLRGTCGA